MDLVHPGTEDEGQLVPILFIGKLSEAINRRVLQTTDINVFWM